MSGPGDVGGEVSGDEAAWRDLVARFESPAGQATEEPPWPAREDLAVDEHLPNDDGPPDDEEDLSTAQPPQAGSPPADGHLAADGIASFHRQVPLDEVRIIRFAGDPRSYTPPDEDDERYKPEPLPPPARLDPVSKGAWLALIGGPGYLLLGTMLRWTISGTEALVAIAAFVAGFVILVVKMGDRPPRDDNDDGAVL